MTNKFEIGQEVIALRNIGNPASGESPGGRLATKGDTLIIRYIKLELNYPYLVSHPEIIDSHFGVNEKEIQIKPK